MYERFTDDQRKSVFMWMDQGLTNGQIVIQLKSKFNISTYPSRMNYWRRVWKKMRDV